MKVLVPYAADDPVSQGFESIGVRVEAEQVRSGVVELVGYAGVFPLVPYDQVTVDSTGTVTGIHRLAPMWVFEVFCRTPDLLGAPSMDDPTKRDIAVDGLDDDAWEAALLGANQVVLELTRMAPVYPAGYAVRVATESRAWFDTWRQDHPHVAFVQVLRRPGSTITFEAMQHTLYDDGEII